MYNQNYIYNLFIFIIIYIILRTLIDSYYPREQYEYIPEKYISSYNYIYSCDHHIDKPISDSTYVPITYPKLDGESIYINTTAIPNFVKNYLSNFVIF